jgi:hypothetical protein
MSAPDAIVPAMSERPRIDGQQGRGEPYDPWRDLADNWPQIEVITERMQGHLLGELRYPVIALRSGTSAAQRRCTLAHELVHLERGVVECGPWSAGEEFQVHAEAARRLVSGPALVRALRELGGDHDLGALAQLVDVDTQTLRLRLRLLTAAELGYLQRVFGQQHDWVA